MLHPPSSLLARILKSKLEPVRPVLTALGLGILLGCNQFVFAAPVIVESPASDRTSTALTIYNSNLALVRETRKINLESGLQSLELNGVSAQIMPETVLFQSDAKPTVLEQNFDFDLLTPTKMLDKFVGESIRLARTNPATGEERIESAVLLSNNQGTVVRVGDRIETNPNASFIFDNIPSNLRDEPTLSVLLKNQKKQQSTVKLSYLSTGFGWKADYVASLNQSEDSIDLAGWVTLTNNSGTSYDNAKLQLVAGDVNRAHSPKIMRNRLQEVAVMAEADSAGFSQQSLFEYHLYTLQRPTSIKNKQTKQVALINASDIKARKKIIFDGQGYYAGISYNSARGSGQRNIKPTAYIEFSNEASNSLGIPLPAGVIRVYKQDDKQQAQFIGEDSIEHTGNKAKIRLKMGQVFDIFADRKITDYNVIDKLVGRDVTETSHEIVVTNGKKEAAEVVVRERFGGEWEINKQSERSSKYDANTAEWVLQLPPESSKTLTYTVRVK